MKKICTKKIKNLHGRTILNLKPLQINTNHKSLRYISKLNVWSRWTGMNLFLAKQAAAAFVSHSISKFKLIFSKKFNRLYKNGRVEYFFNYVIIDTRN